MVDWTKDLTGRTRTGTPGALEAESSVSLVIADATHGHSADSLALTQAHQLESAGGWWFQWEQKKQRYSELVEEDERKRKKREEEKQAEREEWERKKAEALALKERQERLERRERKKQERASADEALRLQKIRERVY